MRSNETPLLSIVCDAYNHRDYIREALDSFLMQKTDFKFEILVNDDASTDGTAEIIREYEAKYPGLFRCVYHEENQWGKLHPWKDILFPMVRGKYVAICEGDDYWTDPLKLQKQVDFMESHPDFAICFHPVTFHYEDGSQPDYDFPSREFRFNRDVLTLKDLLRRNFIQTNSVVYRWRFHKDPLSLIPFGVQPDDWFSHLIIAQTGKIGMLPDTMSVYRKNTGGIWVGAGESDKWFRAYGLSNIRFYQAVQRQFGQDCRAILDSLSIQLYIRAKKHGWDEIFPELAALQKPDLSHLKAVRAKLLGWMILKCLLLGRRMHKHALEKVRMYRKIRKLLAE